MHKISLPLIHTRQCTRIKFRDQWNYDVWIMLMIYIRLVCTGNNFIRATKICAWQTETSACTALGVTFSFAVAEYGLQ